MCRVHTTFEVALLLDSRFLLHPTLRTHLPLPVLHPFAYLSLLIRLTGIDPYLLETPRFTFLPARKVRRDSRRLCPPAARYRPPQRSALRDPRRPVPPSSILHQSSTILLRSPCARSSARNDIPFACAGLSLARVVQHPRFAPTYRKRNFSHLRPFVLNTL